MANEKKNKFLSRVLIVLGVIMSIGGIIGLIGDIANVWTLPEFNSLRWLFGVIVGGFDIWIFGVLLGREHRMDKQTAKNLLYYKIIVAVALLGHLVTALGHDVILIKNPSLGLNEVFVILLCGCLGSGLADLSKTRPQKEG